MLIGVGISLMAGLKSSASPASLFASGEVGVWYDPSDLTTLFQDSAGTTPVTAPGQTVGKMLDKSGRGNHAAQATLAQRPTYQVDSTGRPYLSFDGVDDFMVTGTITPATDKVQVFAGVLKQADLTALLVEIGTTGSNNGSFQISAPSVNGTHSYRFISKGTAAATAGNGAFAPAPDTAILTGIGDISGDVCILRRNGVQVASVTTDQGTGNYLAYALYIGRRNGATLPFNGRLYSLITRFGANLTTGQITSTESWVNGKTGAY